MENWIWGAVAVALLVLAKTVADYFRGGQNGQDAVLTDEAVNTMDGIRVVSRAERRDMMSMSIRWPCRKRKAGSWKPRIMSLSTSCPAMYLLMASAC